MSAPAYNLAGGVSAPPPREAADALDGYGTPLNPAGHAPHGSYAAPTVAGVVRRVGERAVAMPEEGWRPTLTASDYPSELALPLMPDRDYLVPPVATLSDVEQRTGVQSLEMLHDLRRQIVARIAPLAAIFEGGQVPLVDGMRKQHRAWIASQHGDGAEGKLERLANADPRHLRYCAALRELKARLHLLQNDLKDVNEIIRDRDSGLVVHSAEARLHGRTLG